MSAVSRQKLSIHKREQHTARHSTPQDLAAPLSQVLHVTQGVTTATSRYGQTRLATVNSGVRSWELGDALGSVRMTRDGAGTALGSVGELVLSGAEGTRGARRSPPVVPRMRGK